MIFIISVEDDWTTNEVIDWLIHYNREYFRFNLNKFFAYSLNLQISVKTSFEIIIKERVRLLWDLIDESGMRKSLIAMDESEKIDYYSSLIHMSLNRLFRTNQRESEMLICDLLYREYVSRLKRGMTCVDYFGN